MTVAAKPMCGDGFPVTISVPIRISAASERLVLCFCGNRIRDCLCRQIYLRLRVWKTSSRSIAGTAAYGRQNSKVDASGECVRELVSEYARECIKIPRRKIQGVVIVE